MKILRKAHAAALPSVEFVALRLLAAMLLLGTMFGAHGGQAISPRRLIEVVDISGPVMSPDGKQVAFRAEQASVARNTYDSTWYVQNADGTTPAREVGEGGAPLRTSAGLSKPAVAQWSPDGRWIYYRALIGERIDVWRARADGSAMAPVTLDPADVRDFVLSADGKTLLYSVGATRDEVIAAEQAEYEQGIRVDRAVPIGQGGLFRSGNIEGRLATQRLDYLGDGFARVALLSEVPDRWKAIDLATGKARGLAASETPPSETLASKLIKDFKPWRSAQEPGSDRVALLMRATGEGGVIQKSEVDLSAVLEGHARVIRCQDEFCVGKMISGARWRPDSDEVVYTVTDPAEGLAQSIFRWNVKSGVVRQVVRSRGLINGGERYGGEDAGCGVSSMALVCVAAEANRPPRVERIDLETGARKILFDPNASLAADVQTSVPARLLRWTDTKGRSFTGQFFAARHSDSKPPPLFVAHYLCPGFLRSGFGGEWPLATFAEQGISALCINHSPFRFEAVERYNDGMSAVESAVELLASSGEIDRSRVGMGELSYGTEITMWTAFNSDLLVATSITGAMLSRSLYLHGTLKGDEFVSRARRIWQLGPLDETPEQWRRIGLEFNLDKLKAPVLMQVPEQEYVWMLDFAVPLMLDRKADLYVFPHAPHFKFQPRQLLAANERNLDWFRFWLQGFEDPSVSKAGQYAHWRQMRTRRDEASKKEAAASSK